MEELISRQAVLNAITEIDGNINMDIYTNEVREIVKELPPVTPTHKVGKWIYDKAIENWRCSVCNKTPKTMGFCGTSDFMEKEFTFCNHCGAEMRGAEDGSN